MTALAVAGLTLLAAYLLGAVPFGYVVARAKGIDIFQHGSGNIGATNVGRVLGKRYGILVFLLDFAKGAVPVAVAQWVARAYETELPPDSLPVGAGLAAFLGHLFPVYLGFRGGKGVATGAGVVAVLLPGPTAVALLVWLGLVLATRYVSLASVGAACALAVFRLLTNPDPFALDHRFLTGFCLVTALLVLMRHHANLLRLARGTESRLKESPAMLQLSKVVHVLALGLWFGTAVFFSLVVALNLFQTFEAVAEKPEAERPLWFPLPAEFVTAPKEQGTRAAGAAVSPLFDWYFLLQGVCGFLATATALQWGRTRPQDRYEKWRFLLLLFALGTVVLGWPLERKVSELRVVRNQTGDEVLRQGDAATESVRVFAREARAEFGRWHTYSLLLNFATLLGVTGAMALAARLPEHVPSSEAPPVKT